MKLALCTAFLLAAVTIEAPATFSQTAPQTPEPAHGPTMQQTIAFLQENLAKQSEVTVYGESDSAGKLPPQKLKAVIVHLENPCLLVHEDKLQRVLHLDRTDPLSVSIKSKRDEVGQILYSVIISKAVYEFRPFPVQTTPPEISVPSSTYRGGFLVFGEGVVRSIDGAVITYQTERGKVSQIRTTSTDKVSILPPGSPIGMEILASPGRWADVSVGDEIGVFPQNGTSSSHDVDLKKNPFIDQPFLVATYLDQNLSQRVAKALIHAMILCHKEDKPSLF